ncbi:MAG: exo-beta-N-acetylmuramidase NamZ domain-containing protein [Parachlamydiales bacterium]
MLRRVLILLLAALPLFGQVKLGVDRLFSEKELLSSLEGKRVGLITNHTGQSGELESTLALFQRHVGPYQLGAVFAPEHGLNGAVYAEKVVKGEMLPNGVPVHSLYGAYRRPTAEMLKGIDLLVFDIQDVGSRNYTYASTLFYAMEEAAKAKIPVVVLDRPNPINGQMVDGPVLEKKLRSFLGYLEVPYCHGMTIGELARFFNGEYQIGCQLKVIRMKGWKRSMSFADCELPWTPLSPNIPDWETACYFPATGLLGEALTNISIGVGYTLPFKVVGAPWIDGEKLAATLNKQGFAGIQFQPFAFTPFSGRFKGQLCNGVRLVITDYATFKPASTQFLILGVLKSLYPEKVKEGIPKNREMLAKASGSEAFYQILADEPYISWKLIGLHGKEREAFKKRRAPYLLYK